ncbi:zinc ABC transporter substrate-binding protein [bacterium]|nr:zinc ABC transporter substrate-binding protein [bacterium]
MMKKYLFLLILFLVILVGCSNNVATNSKPLVTVSILPQKYFIERIAGDYIEVLVIIPPGASPATFAPTPILLTKMNRSRLYFSIGHLPFEKAWMLKITGSTHDMKVIDTSSGISMITPDEHDHHGKDHDHSGIDPHIWLSCKEVEIQVRNIQKALSNTFPEKKEMFEKNGSKFLKEIRSLDESLKKHFEKIKCREFIVFHPVWSYFARSYGLVQHAIEAEGKKPSPLQMKKIIDLAEKRGIKVIFVQKQFDIRSAQAIAEEINGKVIALDPLAEDWLSNMEKISGVLLKELK